MRVVIIREDQNWWEKEPRVSEHVIEAGTADEVYAIAFREFFNRTKYHQGTRIKFQDASHNAPYDEWVADVNNYANNGGDMW
jgi:hypothetical protein